MMGIYELCISVTTDGENQPISTLTCQYQYWYIEMFSIYSVWVLMYGSTNEAPVKQRGDHFKPSKQAIAYRSS